jgi:hyperosmotically inducible protein
MRKFLFGFLLGIAVTVAAIWYYGDKNPRTHQAKEDLQDAATHTKDVVRDKLDSLNLTPDNIKDELARTGQVVRRKAENLGNTIADSTADARITGTIKAKLVADPDLSALSISVNTTAGRVTLSGTVSSHEKIAKAIQLAMSVDGVQEVVSTLQVKDK